MTPQLGRPIQLSDDSAPGVSAVAVISDSLWRQAYGRSRSVLGQTITLNQAVMTIVGVNPPGFTGAKNVQQSPDLFVPLSMQPVLDPMRSRATLLTNPDFWWVNVMGRIKPDVSEAQATGTIGLARITLPAFRSQQNTSFRYHPSGAGSCIKTIAGLTSFLTLHLFHASGQQAEESIKIVDFRNFTETSTTCS